MERMDCEVRKGGIEAGRPVPARDDGGMNQGICRGEVEYAGIRTYYKD